MHETTLWICPFFYGSRNDYQLLYRRVCNLSLHHGQSVTGILPVL